MSSSEDEGDSWSEPWNPDDAKTSTFSSPNKEKASTSSRPDDKKSSSTSSFSSARPGSSVINTRMGLNDNKAGMEGLDKERINAIIYEASKGSKYYENEQRKDAETERRISKQKCIAEKLSSRDLLSAGQKADAILLELEGTRDLSHSIVHIDMDMFYAAVEMRDNPSLKDKPMAVGGNNMLSTSNYVARRYGVRAAMPGFIAKKLCPQLVIVPLSFRKYSAVSKEVQKVLSQYDPDFGAMSLDEAYLDFTSHITMRQRISQEFRRYPKTCDWARDCSCSQGDREIHKSRNEVKSKDDNDNDEAIGLKDNVDGVERKGDEDQSKGDEVEGKGTENKSKGTEDESKGTEDESKGTEDESEGDEVHGQDDVDKIMCSLCGKCQQTVDEWEEFGVDIEEAVREMRHRIFLNTGLTASAGIAPNTMLAKICSDQNKPNGQCYIVPEIEAVKQFVKTLPIRKVCGIGKVSAQMLSAIDVKVCEDLYKQRAVLYHLYSLHSFTYYMRICLGLGSTQVSSDRQRKSISVERTFQEILQDNLVAAFSMLTPELPGVSVAVSTPDDILTTAWFGSSHYNFLEPIEENSQYRIASITKTFTTALILRMVEEGIIGLDSTLNNYLFIEDLIYTDQMTIRQLLSHTAGVFDHLNSNNFWNDPMNHPNKVWTNSEIFQFAVDAGPSFAPGAGYAYSNTGFYILGAVAEKMLSDDLSNIFNTWIFEPLGLENTFYDDYSGVFNQIENLAESERAYDYHLSAAGGAGAIVSTPTDVAKFGKALYGGDFIQTDLLEEMLENIGASLGGSDYGLGTRIWNDLGIYHYGHTGSLMDYRNILMHVPDKSISIAIHTNGVHSNWFDLVNQILLTTVNAF